MADALSVNRSVINRQIRGKQDINLGRIAEIAWALGYEPKLDLIRIGGKTDGNGPHFVGSNSDFWPGSRVVKPTVTNLEASPTLPTLEEA